MITNRKHEQALQRVRDLAAKQLADERSAIGAALNLALNELSSVEARMDRAIHLEAIAASIDRVREALARLGSAAPAAKRPRTIEKHLTEFLNFSDLKGVQHD